MNFVKELLNEMHMEEEEQIKHLKDELSMIRDVLVDLIAKFKGLNESVDTTIDSNGDIKELLQRAIDRFNAAKRALGLVQELNPGDKRDYHNKRVFGNMNRLRGLVARIRKLMNMSVEEEEISEKKFHPDVIKLGANQVDFDVQGIARQLGYQMDKKTTDAKSDHMWDDAHHDATVFKKKNCNPLLIKASGEVYDHDEGRYIHPLRHEEIFHFMKKNGAVHQVKMNNGRCMVNLNKGNLKKLGLIK